MNKKPVPKRQIVVVIDKSQKEIFDSKLKSKGLKKYHVIGRLIEMFNQGIITI